MTRAATRNFLGNTFNAAMSEKGEKSSQWKWFTTDLLVKGLGFGGVALAEVCC